ncbi:SDR family NAD(P)-dependent oxidoreductase [Rathayibacter sp. YIM 133350]|uniref:SDR family NAD(P)-dependent oxidoreductase n=1 Tax=Rathayibacter sp. YIM 133350 TaxID=3131992 RepID=UPI00307CFDCD
MNWQPENLPDQGGKTFIVTGGNAGLGFFTAAQLSGAGARVILACRDLQKADLAARTIRSGIPHARLSAVKLDTADLDSVEQAAQQLSEFRIDGLIANAGMIHTPRDPQRSVDGIELVMATNYVGHFLLVNRMLPALERTEGSRVLLLGSFVTRLLDSDLTDLQSERSYERNRAYAQSKVAMQVFGFELARRLAASSSVTSSIVVHPGYSISGLTPRIAGINEPSRGTRFADGLQALWAQGKHRGAWPIVRGAVDPGARNGQYWGPRFVTKGAPVLQRPTRTSTDPRIAQRVWAESERILSSAGHAL